MSENEMSRQEAIDYLKRKKKEVTEENINEVMTEGKIYGDPTAQIRW